jgi:ribosomal protein L14
MVQPQTIMDVADNTVAKKISCENPSTANLIYIYTYVYISYNKIKI